MLLINMQAINKYKLGPVKGDNEWRKARGEYLYVGRSADMDINMHGCKVKSS